jgi:hypothetical protein
MPHPKYTDPLALNYHPLEKLVVPRPVDRIEYIRKECAGLRVLDLGAYDETVINRPQHATWRWLHGEIAGTAREVLGVDSSSALKEKGSIRTPVGTTILYGTVADLNGVVSRFKPDLIVAGELIEHTPDALGWMTRLGVLSPGTRLIATTPNATSIINILLSFLHRENGHEDHLHVYSYKTLATLARKADMSGIRIIPYYYDPHQFVGRWKSWLAPVIHSVNRLFLVPPQYLFPLTAFGFILDGVLNSGMNNKATTPSPAVIAARIR